MTNTTAAAVATGNPCLCSTFEVVIREWTEENGQPEIETETTGCTAWTSREFAPGHDAKLKSLLIRAGIAGLEIRRNLGGVVHSGAAANMANDFAFGYMVQTGIERGRAKAAAKAEKKAARKTAPKAKADKPATEMPRKVGARVVATVAAAVAEASAPEQAETPAAETVTVKIGRWSYEATIAANGDAHYKTAKGAGAVAVKGTFKLA